MKPDAPPQMESPQDEPARFCLWCDYPLRGLHEHRCPECGEEFDPDVPATFTDNPRRSRIHRLAEQGELLLLTTTGGFLAVLIAFSFAGISTIYQFMLVFLVTCLAGAIGVGTLLLFALAHRWPSWKRCVFNLSLWFLCPFTAFSQWPLAVGFACHRSAFEKLANQVEAGAVSSAAFPVQIGIYYIESGLLDDSGDVCLFLSGYGPTPPSRAFVRGHQLADSDAKANPLSGEWYLEEF